jgi:hypothetical protein
MAMVVGKKSQMLMRRHSSAVWKCFVPRERPVPRFYSAAFV